MDGRTPGWPSKDMNQKSPVVNLFRLANVVFSEGLREAFLERGQSLNREELDMNLKSDQKLLGKIAGGYSTLCIDENGPIQFPKFGHKICSGN
jgi:hypothetical protein